MAHTAGPRKGPGAFWRGFWRQVRPLAVNLENAVNFHQTSQRQGVGADGKAGMPAGIAKGLDHQIRGTVDNRRLAVEIINRGDKGPQLDNACHPIQIATNIIMNIVMFSLLALALQVCPVLLLPPRMVHE